MNRMFVWAIVFAAFTLYLLAVAGCAVPSEEAYACKTYYVRPGFPPDKRAALDIAVAKWNEVAIRPFCLVDGAANASEIRLVAFNSPEYQAISAEFNNMQVYGAYASHNDSIALMDNLEGDFFTAVAMHELGHAHGLPHLPADVVGIMNPSGRPIPVFTEADLAECVRVGACR